VRLTRYSGIDASSGKPRNEKNEEGMLLASTADEQGTRLASPETPDDCQQCRANYDVRRSVRSVALCMGIYVCTAVIGWSITAVVVAQWFGRP
jgi:hypothetical protein